MVDIHTGEIVFQAADNSAMRPGLRDLVLPWIAWMIVCEAFILAPAVRGATPVQQPRPLRVYFMGNSYTFVNDLPRTFATLAASGGHQVETRTDAAGGELLQGHASDASALAALRATRWSFVVLQEQSEVPAFEESKLRVMYPAARRLVLAARAAGVTPAFLMTWGHAHGLPEAALDYSGMQARIGHAYVEIAREVRAPVAPVGLAWQQVHRQYPELALWQSDGSHPSVAGTYLAACVLYATLLGASPEGLSYTAGLSRGTARLLQATAGQAVLATPGHWDFR